MRHKIISALLIMALVVVGSGFTQTTMKKNGTSGAAMLKVAVGARATAMGGAMTTTHGDVNQLFWNPAGISLNPGETQFTFSYNDWIADLNHNAFAIGHSFGNMGTVAIGGLMSGVSDITANRDVQEGLEGVDYSGGETFDYNTTLFGVSYAKQFTDKLSLGFTVKYYNEKIDVKSVGTFALDFGAVYFVGYRDLAIGARIQNLGGDMEYYYVPFSLPLVFSFGASMSVVDTDFFSFKTLVDASKPIDADQMINGGIEASLYNSIHLRAGYKFNYSGVTDEFGPLSSYQIVENEQRNHWWDQKTYNRTDEGISIGAGVEIPYGDYHLSVDYAWTAFDLLDNVNRFSMTFKF